MKLVPLLAVSALTIFTAVPARADLLYFFNNPSGYQSTLNTLGLTDVNVLFNGAGAIPGPANPVTGRTNVGGDIVAFSSDENLETPSSGQARVDGADGSFDSLTIAPFVLGDLFQAISFNINPVNPGGPPTSGPVTFSLLGPGVAPGIQPAGDQPPVQTVPSNGLFFFGAIAINDQRVSSVDILSPNLLIDDVRQVRVAGPNPGGGDDLTPQPITPIPEPTSLLLLGSGMLLGLRHLRRKARTDGPRQAQRD
jgi:hypothetical protein